MKLVVPIEMAGKRLDQVLSELLPDYSRTRLQSWIKQGAVKVNGKSCKAKEKMIGEEVLDIEIQESEEVSWQGQAIPLNIVYEDEAIIIVNKPIGLIVHPGAGNPDKTLVNALLNYDPKLNLVPRAGIVHRLDKDTSGLLVVARTLIAHHHLVEQLQNRQMHREYQTLVKGELISGSTIDQPIGRHPIHRTKMAISPHGRPSVTHYRILQKFRHLTLLKVQLETGRTHQIRVHLAAINHPIIGDQVYGRFYLPANCSETLRNALQNFKHQALHAWKLTLTHPLTNQELEFTADPPADMQELIDLLKKEG